MKSWLVDVPVCIMVWTRPEVQKQSFAPVKEARPRVLFLASDAGRNEEEKKKIAESRSIVEDIDWDCEVHKIYFEENQGMYAMGKITWDTIFSHVDRVIMLEDDLVASVSFFRFCAELLEKYKDDRRISAINGTCWLGTYDATPYDYNFSYGAAISGYALWKRSYEDQYSINYYENKQLANDMDVCSCGYKKDFFHKVIARNYKRRVADINLGGHPAGGEDLRSLSLMTHYQLEICPNKNMITNIGIAGEHVADDMRLLPKSVSKHFFQPRYELEFPLKHPLFIMRDFNYERLLKKHTPKVLVRMESIIRKMIYLSPKDFIAFTKKKISNRRHKVIEK